MKNQIEIFEQMKKRAKSVNCRVTRDNEIKGSNFIVKLDHNDNIIALSYGWWPMLITIDNVIVRNTYNYSQSTSKHQGKLNKLLNYDNIHDLHVSTSNDIKSENSIVSTYIDRLYYARYELHKPRSRRIQKRIKEKLLNEVNYNMSKLKNIKRLFKVDSLAGEINIKRLTMHKHVQNERQELARKALSLN